MRGNSIIKNISFFDRKHVDLLTVFILTKVFSFPDLLSAVIIFSQGKLFCRVTGPVLLI